MLFQLREAGGRPQEPDEEGARWGQGARTWERCRFLFSPHLRGSQGHGREDLEKSFPK